MPPAAETTTPTPSVSALVDPLSEVTDPRNERFIDDFVPNVLHERGTGPTTLTIDELGASVLSVKFFVACSPSSRFTLTMGGWYAGGCSERFENSGEIPTAPGAGSATVTLELPRGVDFWLLAIPILEAEDDEPGDQ